MNTLKYHFAAGFLFVSAIGTLAHFLYGWSGNNPVVGLFAPINESVWEHMKLLFFPMLLYSAAAIPLFRIEKARPACSLCFGNLTGTLLIPILYYSYTAVLKRNFFVLDIFTFLISAAAAFYTAYKLTPSCALNSCAVLIYTLTATLFFCFIVFTCRPPKLKLFGDPSVHASVRHGVSSDNSTWASEIPAKSFPPPQYPSLSAI